MSDFTFQIFSPTHDILMQAAEVYRICFTAPDKNESWTLEESYTYLDDLKQKEGLFWSIEDHTQNIVGISAGCPLEHSTIYQDLDTKYPNSFYSAVTAIDPNCQGQGLGTKFFQKRIQDIAEAGYDHIVGRCRSENTPMLKIYKNAGFEIVQTYTSSLGGVTCNRVFLKKDL